VLCYCSGSCIITTEVLLYFLLLLAIWNRGACNQIIFNLQGQYLHSFFCLISGNIYTTFLILHASSLLTRKVTCLSCSIHIYKIWCPQWKRQNIPSKCHYKPISYIVTIQNTITWEIKKKKVLWKLQGGTHLWERGYMVSRWVDSINFDFGMAVYENVNWLNFGKDPVVLSGTCTVEPLDLISSHLIFIKCQYNINTLF
jgi:hypothetical protein